MFADILEGSSGLLLASLLTAYTANHYLLPLLMDVAVRLHLSIGSLVQPALIGTRVLFALVVGSAVAWLRPGMPLVAARAATLVFLLVMAIAALPPSNGGPSATLLPNCAAGLVFWLPLAIAARNAGRLGNVQLAGYAAVMIVGLVSALTLNRISVGTL